MFGHGTKSPAGQTIIVAQQPPRNPVAAEFLSTLRRRGARIVETDLANHDRIVAVTLALPHFLNFAMVNTLKGTGTTISKARGVGGTTFKLQMLVAEALYHERLSNEVSILTDNRYSLEILDAFAEEVNTIRREIKNPERGRLLRNLKNGANYVSRDTMFASAYDRFNAAVEASAIN
jgi:prephenate dehydrogenase